MDIKLKQTIENVILALGFWDSGKHKAHHALCVNAYADQSGYINGFIVSFLSTLYNVLNTEYQCCVILFYLFYRLLRVAGEGFDPERVSQQLSTTSPARI